MGVLFPFSLRAIVTLLKQLVDRVVPIPFDYQLPPDSIHLVQILNNTSCIHGSILCGDVPSLVFHDTIIYLVEICVVVG